MARVGPTRRLAALLGAATLLAVAACESVDEPTLPDEGALTPASVDPLWVGQDTTLEVVWTSGGDALVDPGAMWSSSDSSVATVSRGADGEAVVTGESPGDATITATSSNGVDADALVTVTEVPVESVDVTQGARWPGDSLTIITGDSVQLRVTVTDRLGRTVVDRPVTWRSLAGSIASVTASGLARALSAGTALIEAAAEGKADTVTVTVVQPRPDLFMDMLGAPDSSTAGDTLEIVSWIGNAGTTQDGTFHVGYYLSPDGTITTADSLIATCAVAGGLSAESFTECSLDVSLATTAPPGSYFLGAIADYADVVDERPREDNNAGTHTNRITIEPPSDLVVDAVASPAEGVAGDSIAIVSDVRNQGGTARRAFRVGLYLSSDQTITTGDVLLGSCDFTGGLGASSTIPCDRGVEIPSATATGTYWVGAIADDEDAVEEGTQEGNNDMVAANSIQVGPPAPDLVVDSVVAPTLGFAASTINVLADVRNRSIATGTSFRIGIYMSSDQTITTGDVLLGSCTAAAGLAEDATTTCQDNFTIPGGTADGTYWVGAIADDQGAVDEGFREDNNTGVADDSTEVRLAGPDLVIDTVGAPTSATEGGSVFIEIVGRNRGNQATGAFRLGVYLSTNTTISGADTFFAWCDYGGVAASAEFTCSGTVSLPAGHSGIRWIGAIADDNGNQVAEPYEGNNAGVSPDATTIS